MRTETTTRTLYKFDELPEAAQDKAIERYWDINVDFDWWDGDGLTGFTAAEIAKHHLDVKHCDDLLTYDHLYFDLDRGQYIQFDNCRFAHDETARKFLGVPAAIWERVDWCFNNPHYGGGNCGTTSLDYDWTGDKELTPKQTTILNRAVERFSDKMHECWRMLRDDYEYRTGKDAIVETIQANDYEFTEDGEIA